MSVVSILIFYGIQLNRAGIKEQLKFRVNLRPLHHSVSVLVPCQYRSREVLQKGRDRKRRGGGGRGEGSRGDGGGFATIPFHLDLFSAALVELAKSISVHSLILSSHLFFCLPLFLFPFTVSCRIVFAKPEDLET